MPKNDRTPTSRKKSMPRSGGFAGLSWASLLALGFMLAFLAMVFAGMQWATGINRLIYDEISRFVTGQPQRWDIVLVQIDDASVETIGRWPWPRSVIARGIEKIRIGKPRTIGLNLILNGAPDEAAVSEIEKLASLYEQALLETSGETGAIFFRELAQSAQKLGNDRALADAMHRASNVVLPVYLKEPIAAIPSRSVFGNRENPEAIRFLPPAKQWTQLDNQAQQITFPARVLLEAAQSIGFGNFFPDSDGTIRKEPLIVEPSGIAIPAYPLALAASYLGISPEDVHIDPGRAITLGDIQIPVSMGNQMLIRFPSPSSPFLSVSFADILNDTVSAGLFENRLVIVDASASSIHPAFKTPVSASMHHGGITAAMVSTILNRQFYREPDWAPALEVALILLVGLCGIVVSRSPAFITGISFWIGALILVAASVLMLFHSGIWISIGFPLVQWTMTTVAILALAGYRNTPFLKFFRKKTIDNHRLIGLFFQREGRLDLAFENFRKATLDAELREILFKLALDFERKRLTEEASAVLDYLLSRDPSDREAEAKKKRLIYLNKILAIKEGPAQGNDPDPNRDTTEEKMVPSLGRYEIIRQLGKGAMGTVYLGMDPRIRRLTAIKTFHFPPDADPMVIEQQKNQFFREAESAGTLSHPHIVTIYDAGEQADLAYIAMEYLEGLSLEPYTHPENLLPIATVVSYCANVAEALAYAHQKGVIHRDIKPANILLMKSGEIKVADFGIARISAATASQSGLIKGTPCYMSPEQFSGNVVDGRSDIFSLGVTLFQLLTGRLPFTGEKLPELMRYILKMPHPDPKSIRPSIPRPLVQILDKALEKDLEKRYQKASQMAQHLRKLAVLMDTAAKTPKG